MSEAESVPQATERSSPRSELASWMSQQVGGLQAAYRDDQAWAVARLAALRQAATHFTPEVWEVLGRLPASLVGHGDEPSRGEWAAQRCLTLFALHQQSHRSMPMHVPRVPPGLAIRKLAGPQEPEPSQAVARRFKALGAAATVETAVYHLRGLVTQLRGADQPMDYSALAKDLWDLQDPVARERVRLRWGRDFYTYRPPGNAADGDNSDSAGSET